MTRDDKVIAGCSQTKRGKRGCSNLSDVYGFEVRAYPETKGVDRYPLVLMLEPLFRCNLACAGCGKYSTRIMSWTGADAGAVLVGCGGVWRAHRQYSRAANLSSIRKWPRS